MSNQKGNLTELKFYVARQHDHQQSKYYFEPCELEAFLIQEINLFVIHRSLRFSSEKAIFFIVIRLPCD